MVKVSLRGGLWSPLSGLLAALILLLMSPVLTNPTFGSDAERDVRVSPQLENLLQWAGENQGRSALGTLSEEAATGALLEVKDYGQATPKSSMLLILEGTVGRAELEALGVSVNTQAGGVTTVQARLEQVPAILGLSGIKRITTPTRVRPMGDVSVPEIGAVELWSPSPNPPSYSGLTGNGVVVGIVDSGLDLDHADFRTSNNKTRVKYAWDQTWVGSPPSGFSYGTQYTESQINAGAASAFKDMDGHGTHITGIAAGNGRATGNGQPNYQYIGVAPEADLIIVKTGFADAQIIDGVNYIFQKAAQMGKPAVVNLSIGTQSGSHDGGSSLEMGLSALTGAGKLITAPVGNDHEAAFHASKNLSQNQTSTLTFNIPAYTPGCCSLEYLDVEGWYDPTASFRVKVTSPSGYNTGYVSPGGSSGWIQGNDGNMILLNGQTTSGSGAKMIHFRVLKGSSTSPPPAAGNWTITLNRVSPSTTGRCDFWVADWLFGSNDDPTFTTPDPTMTLTSPATADAIISTGAYVTKDRWTNGSGGISSYGFKTEGEIIEFSALGPRRDGQQRPDVVAPGYSIASALSGDAPSGSWNQTLDRVHYVKIGTSQANAHTTGGLALLLEDAVMAGDPWLTPAGARSTLISRARQDTFTGAVPNDTYGYGKLHVTPQSSTGIAEVVPPLALQLPGSVPQPRLRRHDIPVCAGSAPGGSGRGSYLRPERPAGRGSRGPERDRRPADHLERFRRRRPAGGERGVFRPPRGRRQVFDSEDGAPGPITRVPKEPAPRSCDETSVKGPAPMERGPSFAAYWILRAISGRGSGRQA